MTNKMTETNKWECISPENGYGKVKLTSWQYFLEFVYEEMLDYETYIWRGQRCSHWELESTLDRLIKKAKIKKTKHYDFAEKHLEQFKYAVRGRRGASPTVIQNENDWWALGQHHGLFTPLLDWTLSPFVAAYFAFIDTGDTGEKQTKYRAVYALHKPSIETKVKDIIREAETTRQQEKEDIKAGKKKVVNFLRKAMLDFPIKSQVEFIRPLSDENHRLVNQGGLFTRIPSGKTLDSWVKEHFKDDKDYTLIKILIPDSDREQCLRTLNRMNINHLSLFPDLYGASKFCNLFGEIEKY